MGTSAHRTVEIPGLVDNVRVLAFVLLQEPCGVLVLEAKAGKPEPKKGTPSRTWIVGRVEWIQ